jgi:BirA family biotin operon repressor/biotin-[acetyl-CoA-carboxylase] ligase
LKGASESTRHAPEAWPSGWHVERVAATGSTNDDLIRSAAQRRDRSVLIADYQHAGRGRRDRTWTAMPGENLLASILFHDVPTEAMELPRRVCLAAVEACRLHTAGSVALKWPNDVLLDGRKLAGVLAQRTAAGSVVVGIGINVGWAPDGAARLDASVEPAQLLVELLAAFDRLPTSGHELRDRYRRELATLGQRVRVVLPDGELLGTATDLAFDGRLVVVDDAGAAHRLSVGDVVHLRPS